MIKKSWNSFTGLRSNSFVRDLLPEALEVPSDMLVVMRDYRRDQRISACGGHDPIRIVLAYAQDELAYDSRGNITTISDTAIYQHLGRDARVNKFGLSYRRDAELYLHRTLADIVIDAAIHLSNSKGWTTVLYDGLRTMEGAFNLYQFAPDSDIEEGLLALPGASAHNKGLAVDSMMEDAHGREVAMGGHFDHLDMQTNSRAYRGVKLSPEIQANRLIREAAFLRSAFSQGLLVAPLRSEFWDDRLPENREDLWRVLDSTARCIGRELLTHADIALRKADREAFRRKWESWSYADFLVRWQEVFQGQEKKLESLIGNITPPLQEKIEFYHGNYQPIYDSRLRAFGKHLTVV